MCPFLLTLYKLFISITFVEHLHKTVQYSYFLQQYKEWAVLWLFGLYTRE